MGSWYSKAPSNPGRVIMIGLDSAGKTSLMYRLKCGDVTTSIPTIGFNVESLSLGRNTDLLSWDVGGRCPMRPLWRHYFQEVRGVVFVVDSSDKERMEQAADELARFMAFEELSCTPLMLLANKQDLPNAAALAEVNEAMRLTLYCRCADGETRRRLRACASFAVSVATAEGLREAFDWLAAQIKGSAPPPPKMVAGEDGSSLVAAQIKGSPPRNESSAVIVSQSAEATVHSKLRSVAEGLLPKAVLKYLLA